MKTIKFIVIFLSIAYQVMAQEPESPLYTIQVDYKMTYVPDSNDRKQKQEFMELLVNSGGSLFRSKKKGVMDSANYAASLPGNPKVSDALFSENMTKINYQVRKKGAKTVTYDEYRLNPDRFNYYSESGKLMDWQITQDTLSISGLKCQKATTNFGGRKWEAWFTSELNINDGPYKFSGLPGLIVKLSDQGNNWNFELISTKNINRIVVMNYEKRWPLHETTKEKFLKEKRDYLDNKMQIEEASGLLTFPDAKARELSQKYYKDQAIKDNNWIELYRAKGK